MNFKIIDNGKEIEAKIILTFKDSSNDINYIVYTDGSVDSNGEEEVYVSRYKLKNGNYILKAIENNYEWDLVDNMLESKYKELEG